jgi:alpha-tubulin suppressor-like RCC1 family protein
MAPASGYAETGAAAVAWGENLHTELGAGYKSGQAEPHPVTVVGLSTITAIAGGNSFDIALLSNETVDAWGGNTYADLGDGSRESTWQKQVAHVAVSGLSNVKEISAAGEHSLARLSNGTLMAWGTNNDGELGNGTGGVNTTKLVPSEVPGLTKVKLIASGAGTNFALLENGELMAWGRDNRGQLGIGNVVTEKCVVEGGAIEPCITKPRAVLLPEAVKKGLVQVTAVAAGESFTLALLSNGSVLAWGDNGKGQLGTGGSNINFYEPQTVANIGEGTSFGKAIAVSAGSSHGLAVLATGKVVGWGKNSEGQVGEKSTEECQKVECYKTPHQIAGLENATAVFAGTAYSLVVVSEKLYSFGLNDHQQLGRGSTETFSRVPALVTGTGMEHVAAVAGGALDAIALLKPEVAPPAAFVTLTPETGALRLRWTYPSSEYKVCLGPFEINGTPTCTATSKVTISETSEKASYEAKSYVFTGLNKTSYVVNFKVTPGESGRWLSGTPF